jgi:hypothetical protein
VLNENLSVFEAVRHRKRTGGHKLTEFFLEVVGDDLWEVPRVIGLGVLKNSSVSSRSGRGRGLQLTMLPREMG